MHLDPFLSAFVSMFVVVDPFGTAAVFLALTQKMTAAMQRKIAVKAVSIAVLILLGFSLLGESLLDHMGITLSAFRVAGGLLLFVTAFRMIMGYHDPDQLNSEKTAYRDLSAIAVFPLAIPMLSGPGTITAMVMFSTAAQTPLDYAGVVAATILVQAIALACLIGAGALSRFLGPTGYGIITRVMGILLAALSVQFISDGLHGLFHLAT
ncbi:MAG TPA: MarC family protein [Alphaproteobacteria bacterium]